MDVTEDTNADTAEFDPVEALMKAWEADDADKPSDADKDTHEEPKDPTPEVDPETPDEEVQGEEDEAEGAEESAEEDAPEKSYADDDVYVKHVVDGEEREFSIKDLKRLAGQEASLTRKSQEVAEQRKAVDTANQANTARVNGLLQRALERWKPYENVNLLVAAKTLEPDQLQALQTEMQARWEDIQFLQQEHGALTTQIQTTQRNDMIAAARECIKTLSDPQTGIEGWNEQKYGEICSYAKTNGVSQDLINGLTDPAAFKLLQKAMLYDKGVKTVQRAKDKATTPNKGKTPPKKIVKSTASANSVSKVLKPSKAQEATKRLRATGDRDDAVDALMAMWGESGDE